MKLGVDKVKKVTRPEFSKKNLNPIIKGDEVSKVGVLHDFVLIFCMTIESNMAPHLSVLPYLYRYIVHDLIHHERNF